MSRGAPFEVQLQAGRPPVLQVEPGDDRLAWVAEHQAELRAIVAEHGALHLHGLGLDGPGEVGRAADSLSSELVIEREAFAARTPYPGPVYSSSTWPAKQQMCMHHEQSYRIEAPGLMLFACLQTPAKGGTIGLADASAVLDALPRDIVVRFEQQGWRLDRNYTDEIGLSVTDAFGADDPRAIEGYCREHAIEFEWQPDGGLRTRQRRPAVVDHPVTGQRCWFNQIAFLSEWTMNPEVHDFLVDMYGPEGLPFNTRFGNGDPIESDIVEEINETYDANTVREPLLSGDLVLIDNVRTAHSRDPFEGDRQVIVAMADPVRLAESTATADV